MTVAAFETHDVSTHSPSVEDVELFSLDRPLPDTMDGGQLQLTERVGIASLRQSAEASVLPDSNCANAWLV
jgi:hypothetical protein